MTTGALKAKAAKGLWKMVNQQNNYQKRVTGRSFEYARLLFNQNNPFRRKDVINEVRKRMLEKNPMKNAETAKKVSDSLKGRFTGNQNRFYGKKHTDKTIAVIREKATGRKMSEEGIQKRLDTIKNNNKPRIWITKTCPHCGHKGIGGAMTRFHFKNCITLRN